MPHPPSRVSQGLFWSAVRSGQAVEEAGATAGVSFATAGRWFRQRGGVSLWVRGRSQALSLADREEIFAGLNRGRSYAEIARRLGRVTSTVTRELQVNRLRPSYRPAEPVGREKRRTGRRCQQLNYSPSIAHARAEARRGRPKMSKLATNPRLREQVQARLARNHSPEQIAGRLRVDYPDDPEMRVSHETIYRALFVQGRGALNRELIRCLRTGRSMRKPRRQQTNTPRNGGTPISERPPEAADRALPGHYEGDLIIGAGGRSAIATVVERRSRFTLLGHLPGGHSADQVATSLIATLRQLPDQLVAQTLTWDQGCELARHRQIAIDADVQIFFCDPASPWQRPTNENTNGLLRQYFPKGTDLALHAAEHLATVAAELNDRPRKSLGYRTPTEVFYELLSTSPTNGVATIP